MDCQLQCQCGQVKGQVANFRHSNTNRAVCYCKFCRAYLAHLNQEALLDDHGGTDIVQVSPKNLTFREGQEHIRALKLTEKGAFRFYAGCCQTPLVNTAQNWNIPFAGVNAACLLVGKDSQTREESLGPIRLRVNGHGADFYQLPKTDRYTRYKTLLRIGWLLLAMKLTGAAKHNPFRNSQRQPIVDVVRVKLNETRR